MSHCIQFNQNSNLFVFRQCIHQHVVGKNVELVTPPPHVDVSIESFAGIARAQEGLKQALVSVAVHVEIPFLHQPNTGFQVFGAAEQADKDVDGGDVATYAGAVHVAEDRPD